MMPMPPARPFKMRVKELTDRGRREVLKWWERTRLERRAGARPWHPFKELARRPALAEVRRLVRKNEHWGAAALLRNHFRDQFPSRFFEGVGSDELLGLFTERFPADRTQLVASAEEICRGRFNLLGYRGLEFGDPVDWHVDPTSRRRTPLLHWSRIDPLDSAVVGDCKVVWELNRHQWLVTLGQAYQLTTDERYAAQFDEAIRDWIRTNPVGMGINWVSGFEVALRLIAWCWGLALFRESPVLTPDFFTLLVDAIRLHASHVERYLSSRASPNIHPTGEALGLFYAGVLFPELRSAHRWRALGSRILVDQIGKQMLPDGTYFEQSTCYQRYTIETYLHFLILASRNGIRVPSAVAERLQGLLDSFLAFRQPDGFTPQIGEAVGGRLLPLEVRATHDDRGIFSTAAALFNRADYAWAANGLAPETCWLLGPLSLKIFGSLTPNPPSMPASRAFEHGGYVVMRSGWEPQAHHLIFDVGPLGSSNSGGHGHADLLSVHCSVFGEPCIVDPGMSGYAAHRRWWDFFRNTAAHSTVLVDGVGQVVPSGPFSWQHQPRARLRQWLATDTFELADADHEAYSRLADPVRHRRRVIFVKRRYWVLVDDLDGREEHRVELRFQFAPLPAVIDPALWGRIWTPKGHGLLIRAFAGAPLRAELSEGEEYPIQGWYSPAYGQLQPAPVLIYSTVTRLPLRIVTLLFPAPTALSEFPNVSPLFAKESAKPVGLILKHRKESILIWEQGVRVDTDGPYAHSAASTHSIRDSAEEL